MSAAEMMEIEMGRVRRVLGEAVAELEADGGDLRMFAAALLAAAVQLHTEIEGTEHMQRAIAKLATAEMVRAGEAGRC